MRKSGIWLLAAAAVLCSIGGVCIKSIPWTPMAINGARNAIAACVTFLYLRAAHKPLRWNSAVLCGALSLALTTNLYVLATKLTSAACAILLMYTAPLWVILYLWAARRKRPAPREVLACVLVLGGLCLFLADSFAAGTMLGFLCGLFSGVSYAGVFLVNTWPGGDASSGYFYGQVLGAAVGLPFLLGERIFTPTALVCVMLLGVFQLGLSYVLMAKGVARTPPVTASLVTALEPVLTPVWVAIFTGEVPTALALCGAALVLASVVWNAVTTRKTSS